MLSGWEFWIDVLIFLYEEGSDGGEDGVFAA